MQPSRHKNSVIFVLRKRLTSLRQQQTNSNQMKRILQISAFAFLIMLGGSWQNKAAAQADINVDISYQTFYDELSPYGEWIDYPEYGYVWVPEESDNFRPYESNGHWVWTDDYEWMWVSDYAWGWAPFHYGRWFNDPYYGWMWVPGYEWSPAWVCWRDGGDYYGWAPLRPGINISFGFSIGSYNPPVDYWCFAPRQYISSPRIYDYCLDRSRNVTIINNTTIINNYNLRNNVFVTGPRRLDAERYAGRINPVRFRESSGPGRTQFRNNEVSTYRPGVERNNERRFAPRNFEQYDRNRSQGNSNVFRNRDNNVNQRNGNNLPERRNDNRFGRNSEQSNTGNNDNRRFDRRNNVERPNQEQRNNDNGAGNIERQQGQQRQFERQQQMERQQGQQRQMERQQQPERQQGQQRQFERQQPQQPQVENRGGGGNDRQQRGGGNDNGGRGRGRRF